MLKRGTITLWVLVSMMLAGQAIAQPMQVTIRDINAIPQNQVDQLNAGGATLTSQDIQPLVLNDLQGVEVQFVAVVLSDPLSSGLGTPQDDQGGNPDRVHVFVRDTSAVSMGYDGMGLQLADGSYLTTGLINVTVGDVIKVTGTASAFTGSGGNSQQVGPSTIEVLGSYSDLGLPDSLLDPVVITTADANRSINDEGGVQVNWDNLASLNGQYVRLEGASITVRDISSERPNWLVSSDGGETVFNFYDVSLRYRNDRRNSYPSNFNVRTSQDGNFVPPPPGAAVNLQGFILYQGDDPFGRGVPGGAILSIAPIEDADLVITESPPIFSGVTGPTSVPDGSEDVTISVGVDADPTRTLTSVVCTYTSTADGMETMIEATLEGEAYVCVIPAQPDGAFVTYTVSATDSQDATTVTDPAQYRTLVDGINEISDIQLTADEGPGNSPFAGLTTPMAVTGIVVSDPATSGRIVIQDNADLAGWSGIFINGDAAAFSKGDVVTITEAEIRENFGVTELRNAVFTVDGTDTPYDYKVVPTTAVKDAAVAEAHEGMMLRFEDVIMGPNPDAPSDFGEWSFATVGTEDFIRADDASSAVPSTTNDDFIEGGLHEFMQGIWWFSFSNYKLIPESPADIGALTNVATEDETIPGSFALHQNFPNPFNPTTSIRFDVPQAGHVSLEVFDLIGRKVQTLVDGTLAAGQHSVSFSAGELPSGMYLYRLTAGSDVQTRKMVLLK
ncbi:MAG: T9SS type A sorting domain-containing protein [Rhodothermales bacterium]